MRDAGLNRFYGCGLAAYAGALALANGIENSRSLILPAVFLFACGVWRELHFGSRYLHADTRRLRARWERRLYFVFGVTSEDEEAEREEVRDLGELISLQTRLKSVLAYGFLAASLIWLHQWRGLTFPRGTGLILMGGLVLVNASHASHLFAALALSVPYVLWQTWSVEDGMSFEARACLAFYVIAFFLALMFYRRLCHLDPRQAKDSARMRFPVAHALGTALVFLSLLWVFDWLMPSLSEPRPPEPRVLAPMRAEIAQSFARRVAEQVVDYQMRKETAGSKGENAPPRMASTSGPPRASQDETMGIAGGPNSEMDGARGTEAKPFGLQSASTGEASTLGHGQAHGLGGGDHEPSADTAGSAFKELEDLRQDAERSGVDKRLLESFSKERLERGELPSEEDLKKLSDELRTKTPVAGRGQPPARSLPRTFTVDQMKALAERLQTERQPHQRSSAGGTGVAETRRDRGVMPSASRAATADSSGAAAERASFERGGGGGPDPGDESGDGSGAEAGRSHSSKASSGARELNKSHMTSERADRVAAMAEKIAKKFELSADVVTEVFKMIAILLAVVMVGSFLLRLLRQPDIEKARRVRLSKEARRLLRDRFNEIRARRLSPREEIIATYHTVLAVFAEAQLPRREDTPVGLFAETVAEFVPPIAPAMTDATECFEVTLYGEWQISEERLDAFRGSTRRIFAHFNV